jgi:hypothetical protein
VQKIPGDAAATSVQQTINAGTPEPLTENPQTNPFYFRNTGKPRLALKTPRRSLHAGKVPNGVGLEKPAAPLPSPPNRRKIVSSFVVTLSCSVVLWSWRRDLNPRPPDYKSGALPTELRQQLGKGAPSRKLIPLIPARCPGQLIKLSQRELLAQARCIGASDSATRGCEGGNPGAVMDLDVEEKAREIRLTFGGAISGKEAYRYAPERQGRSGGGTKQRGRPKAVTRDQGERLGEAISCRNSAVIRRAQRTWLVSLRAVCFRLSAKKAWKRL